MKAARVEIPEACRGCVLTSSDGPYCQICDTADRAWSEEGGMTFYSCKPGPSCPGPGVKLLIGEEKLTREALARMLCSRETTPECGASYCGTCAEWKDYLPTIDALRAHLGVTDG